MHSYALMSKPTTTKEKNTNIIKIGRKEEKQNQTKKSRFQHLFPIAKYSAQFILQLESTWGSGN